MKQIYLKPASGLRVPDPATGSGRNMPAWDAQVNTGFPLNLAQSTKFLQPCDSLAGSFG